MLKLFAPLALTLFCFAAPATAADQKPPAEPDLKQLIALRVDKQHQATGVVIGVVDPSGAHVSAYGTTGLKNARPMDADTVFDVGSLTKVITALLVADMASRGEVNLDDPVMKYLPADRVTIPTYLGSQITFTDLATHTSGLPLRPDNLTSTDPENKYAGYTLDKLYAFLSHYKLTRKIGSQYEYSNVGYGLIGPAVTGRTGKSWSELVRTRITTPLGMNDTSADLTPDMKKRMASGYALDISSLTLTPAPHWDLGALESAGALRSTPRDMMQLLSVAIGLTPSPLSAAFETTTKVRRPGGMGAANAIALAWNIYRSSTGHDLAWKNGNVGGFRTFIGFDKTARRGVVAFANAQTGTGVDDIGLHLLDPAFPVDTHIPKAHKEIALAPAVLDRYVGRYKFSDTDIINIERNGKYLTCELGPEKIPLYPESEREFFLKVADIQLTFDAVENGRAKKVIWHQNGAEQVGIRID